MYITKLRFLHLLLFTLYLIMRSSVYQQFVYGHIHLHEIMYAISCFIVILFGCRLSMSRDFVRHFLYEVWFSPNWSQYSCLFNVVHFEWDIWCMLWVQCLVDRPFLSLYYLIVTRQSKCFKSPEIQLLCLFKPATKKTPNLRITSPL